jgi:hypothetical protein
MIKNDIINRLDMIRALPADQIQKACDEFLQESLILGATQEVARGSSLGLHISMQYAAEHDERVLLALRLSELPMLPRKLIAMGI